MGGVADSPGDEGVVLLQLGMHDGRLPVDQRPPVVTPRTTFSSLLYVSGLDLPSYATFAFTVYGTVAPGRAGRDLHVRDVGVVGEAVEQRLGGGVVVGEGSRLRGVALLPGREELGAGLLDLVRAGRPRLRFSAADPVPPPPSPFSAHTML